MSSSRKVLVTGVGIISAIGTGWTETLNSIKEKKSGAEKVRFLKTVHREVFPLAEVPNSDDELKSLCQIQSANVYSRTSLLGIAAVKEAIISAGLSDLDLSDVSFISGNSVGGMDKSENFYPEFKADNSKGKISLVSVHDCGESTESIALHFGLSGYITTISTACSSAANAIMFGARLIKAGLADKVIAGGTDSLTRFTLNGFNSLMIVDKQSCRPFDSTRAGLNLGEGAGFLVLEAEDSIAGREDKIICELSGYGNSCDAFHQTATSDTGDGPYLAMKEALESAGINPSEISYINAHGTGTGNNDLTEGIAIQRLFGTNPPPFSSTKPYTGHTLGAAGGIEAVLSAMAVRNGMIYPNLNFRNQTEGLEITPALEFESTNSISHVLSNSFGFGGNDSSLVFSKADRK